MTEIKQELIDKITKIELEMFINVKSKDKKSCKEKQNSFKVVRGKHHSVLSKKTLRSYLEDLKKARKNNENLMTKKYAKIEGQLPFTSFNSKINKTIDIHKQWYNELYRQYPNILSNYDRKINGVSFWKVYLRSELEIFSDKTLELYYKDMLDAAEKNENLIKQVYNKIFKVRGYNSIDEAEKNITKSS